MNELGNVVRSHWLKLSHHHAHVELDAWVIMPNHIHGILIFNTPGRGAALDQGLMHLTDDVNSNATPNPNPSEPGVAFGQEMVDKTKHQLPNAAPLPPRLRAGTVGAIVLNFKSVTTRSLNRVKRSPGSSIWQRNYYEHIIRNEEALKHIRQYVHNNPVAWQHDQLHPDNPAKW